MAKAGSCSASVSSPVTFSNVDPFSGNTYDTSATLSVTCSGYTLNPLLALCYNVGSGTGGTNASNERLLAGPGGGTFRFQVFQDAARLVPWGSTSNGLLGGVPLLSLTGNGSTSLPMYFRLYTAQGASLPGTYSSVFSGADSQLNYGTVLNLIGGCGGLLSFLTSNTSAPFTVQTVIPNTCTLNVTQNVAFGAVSTLSANVDSTGNFTVQCTNGTAFQTGLSAGNGAGATTAVRLLTGPGSATIAYALYQDAARTVNWGNALGVDTKSGTGDGTAQSNTVYARVPSQASNVAGVYSDTVIVTVTY
jgi:spore coat protein U-like protein